MRLILPKTAVSIHPLLVSYAIPPSCDWLLYRLNAPYELMVHENMLLFPQKLTVLQNREKQDNSHFANNSWLFCVANEQMYAFSLTTLECTAFLEQVSFWEKDLYFKQIEPVFNNGYWSHLPYEQERRIARLYQTIRADLTKQICTYLALPREHKLTMIDLGTGFGQLIASIQSRLPNTSRIDYIGIDTNMANIKKARERCRALNTYFLQKDNSTLPAIIEEMQAKELSHEFLIVSSGGMNRQVMEPMEAFKLIQIMTEMPLIKCCYLSGLSTALIPADFVRRLGWSVQIIQGIKRPIYRLEKPEQMVYTPCVMGICIH